MTNLIREKLDIRNKGYSWLAKKTGLTKAYISRLVNGTPRPSILTAHKVARALDSTIEEVWIFK